VPIDKGFVDAGDLDVGQRRYRLGNKFGLVDETGFYRIVGEGRSQSEVVNEISGTVDLACNCLAGLSGD